MSVEAGGIIAIAQAEGLPAAVAAGWRALSQLDDYSALDWLVDELAQLAASFPPSADLTVLRGSTYQKRCEWAFASDLLSAAAPDFPERADVAYEAALNSLDAGYYPRAEALLAILLPGVASHSSRIQRGMWRAAALVGRHDIAIAAFEAALAAGSPYAEPQLSYRMRAAAAIQLAMKQNEMDCISIGENCLPWMLLNRWGFRAHPTHPRADSIFNLAQTSTNGCTSILEDAGGSLMAPNDLKVSLNSNGAPLPINQRCQIAFNHEQGRSWVKDDFTKLRERYAPRVDNFASTLDGPQRLYVHYTEVPGDISRLLDAICSINKNDAFRVLVIDATGEDRLSAASGFEAADYLHAPLPRPDHVWFRPDDLDSLDGVAFEWRIAEAALQSLGKLLRRNLLDIKTLGPPPIHKAIDP